MVGAAGGGGAGETARGAVQSGGEEEGGFREGDAFWEAELEGLARLNLSALRIAHSGRGYTTDAVPLYERGRRRYLQRDSPACRPGLVTRQLHSPDTAFLLSSADVYPGDRSHRREVERTCIRPTAQQALLFPGKPSQRDILVKLDTHLAYRPSDSEQVARA